MVCGAFWGALLLVLATCSPLGGPLHEESIASLTPFGLTWDEFNEPGDEIGGNREIGCLRQIDQLGTLISTNRREVVLILCISDRFHEKSVSIDQLPSFFRNGEVNVTIKGRSEPAMFEYSYLHRMSPDLDSNNVANRKRHASILRRQLNRSYGPPAASGYFDQFRSPGFVAATGTDQPCDLWISEKIGIVLCTERVVLIDGIEMSLSFIHLDRAPFGKMLQCMANAKSADECTDEPEKDEYEYPNEHTSFLDVLTQWLKPEQFHQCRSDELEPLDSAWVPSLEARVKADTILKSYVGEALDEYIFENAGELSEDGTETDEQKRFLNYLLKKAAEQGSAGAMNEIGASLLYCYQNVQQDTVEAQKWLRKAADGGDTMAMKSLALMHLSGMVDGLPAASKAAELLEECSKIQPDECANELRALTELTTLLNE
jgi:hypothetical protein